MISKNDAVSGREQNAAILQEKHQNDRNANGGSGKDKPLSVTAKTESKSGDLLDILISPNEQANYVSNQLLKKKRRNQNL